MTTGMVILFDQFNLPDNIFEIIFATKQQVVVAKLLVEEMKSKDGEMGKTEMSMFATALHEGRLVEEVAEGPIKPKKKIKLYRYTYSFYETPNDFIIESPWTNMSADFYKDRHLKRADFHIKTEEKEIEVPDE